MHYDVIRHDTNVRTGQPMDDVMVGVAMNYNEAKIIMFADEQQFRVPGALRYIVHQYIARTCTCEDHLPGPYSKGRL